MFKEFKAFWTCYFTSTLVKIIDNFYKLRGIIDGFNESRKQILFGVVETTDESMSAIRSHITPKGDLPHYSYIVKKPEQLGTEINNVACSSLEIMLYLEIQNWKEAMKVKKFNRIS